MFRLSSKQQLGLNTENICNGWNIFVPSVEFLPHVIVGGLTLLYFIANFGEIYTFGTQSVNAAELYIVNSGDYIDMIIEYSL